MTEEQKIAEFIAENRITDFGLLESLPDYVQETVKDCLLAMGREFGRQASVYTENIGTESVLYLSAAQCLGIAANLIRFDDEMTQPLEDAMEDLESYLSLNPQP